jgi:hypothetical protein
MAIYVTIFTMSVKKKPLALSPENSPAGRIPGRDTDSVNYLQDIAFKLEPDQHHNQTKIYPVSAGYRSNYNKIGLRIQPLFC